MEATIGAITMFGGNFAPRGYAYCDGQLLSIAQNQALFSILGTTYGGDGRTTFALPDLRGRTPIGTGTGPGLQSKKLGQRSGIEYSNLTSNQLPSHSHTVDISPLTLTPYVQVMNDEAGDLSPAGNYLAQTEDADNKIYGDSVTAGNNLGGVAAGLTGSIQIASAGGSQAFNNMQPSEAIHYVIALVGIFPSRN